MKCVVSLGPDFDRIKLDKLKFDYIFCLKRNFNCKQQKMDMNRLMGHVTLNEIKDAVRNEAIKKDDEIMLFRELSNAIRELHSRKLGDDCTSRKPMDSYANRC